MGGAMTQPEPDAPEILYRGLDRCDQCGGPLAPREQLAGLCVTGRDAYAPTNESDDFSP